MKLFVHGTLLMPNRSWSDLPLLVDQGKIVGAGSFAALDTADAELVDASGLLIAPGLCDVQLNGAWGDDFTLNPSSIWQVARRLPQWGVTSFLPTIITSPLATVAQAIEVLQAGPPPGWSGARPLGLHLEGPFLNPQRRGAHPPHHLALPDLTAIDSWQAPWVRLVTLAPELAGADELIAALVQHGVTVNAGHSLASYEEARSAFAAGVTGLTHMFNAMTSLHHREPGLAVAALDDPHCIVGLIPDGLHVHPAWIRLLWRLLGPERICLVTDAMAALGMSPGLYELGDSAVTVDADSARLADGRLAGSVLDPLTALHNLRAWTGCSLAEALTSFSATPARLLGHGCSAGSLRPGNAADLILLQPDGSLHSTFVAGHEVWNARSEVVC